MTHLNIRHDEKPIRLFHSDFLEFFTHVSPLVVILIFLPIILYLLITAATPASSAAIAVLAPGFLSGVFIWTLAEYTLHRFLFHFKPHNPAQERLSFLFHGVHHAQPQCKTRLVMPPALSIPLAALFYALFVLFFGSLLGASNWIAPSFAGFLSGYLAYDLTHYATHHFAMRTGYLKFLKRYHMQHHYKTPNQRYGVTSPLWDMAFGTRPKD